MSGTTEPPRFMELFARFALISSVTIGGGYAIVPVIERALSDRGWLEEEAFASVFTRAQSFPGPLALNVAVLAGREISGWHGALAGFLGVILPPFLVIVAVSASYGSISRFKPVNDFLSGASWTIPGLVAAMLLKSARRISWTIPKISTAVMGTALMLLFPAYTLPVFLTAGFIALRLGGRWKS